MTESVNDFKEQISEILSKSLLKSELDKVSETIEESISAGNLDFKLADTKMILRMSDTTFTVFNTEWGDIWTIPVELFALFSIIRRHIEYADLARIRESFISNKNMDNKDFSFICQIKNFYFLTNIIDYTIRRQHFIHGLGNDVEILFTNPMYLDTSSVYEWLNQDFGIRSISPIHVNGLRFGDVFV